MTDVDPTLLRLNGYGPVAETADLRQIRKPQGLQAELVGARLDPSRGYDDRMPPPDPDPLSAATDSGLVMPNGAPAASTGNAVTPSPDKRVCIGFGPQPGALLLSLERGPDWEVNDGEAWMLPIGTVRQMMPILRAVVRVKDMTGGLWQGLQLVQAEEESDA